MNGIPFLCAAYLIGSIPTGLWMGRLLKGVDVRRFGSGNVGATNVYRVVGKLPGLMVLLVDAAKGWVPVVLLAGPACGGGEGLGPESLKILLGMAAVAGHIWNPFLQFRGGRGVATGLGVLFALDPRVGACSLGVWLTTLVLTRYVSVASITAAFCAPFLILFLGHSTLWVLGGVAVSLAIIARHRPNLLRLLQGEEHRISIGRSAKNPPEDPLR